MAPQDSSTSAADVVNFWLEAGQERWFSKNAEFDALFRERFSSAHEAASEGRLDAWQDSPEGCLALVLLLDQFPRNCFRGSPRAYATDPAARAVAARAIDAGYDEAVDQRLRLFFYLPFEHSESPEDQERSVALHQRIGFTEYALQHQDIIRRFGRFPHRNAVLGRVSTAEEQEFLARGGFAG